MKHNTSKKKLNDAILKSKLRYWKFLCEAINKDLWGKGYQIISGRLGNRVPVGPQDPQMMKDIVNALSC